MKIRNLSYILVISLFVCGIILLIWSYVHGFDLLEYIRHHESPQKAGLWIIGILFVFRNYIFLPSTVVILAAGYILQDFWLASIVSILWVAIGLIQVYFVGKTFCENVPSNPLVQVYISKIRQHWFKIIFFWSLVPLMPVDIIYYAAALSRYPFAKFFLAWLLWELPLILLYAYLWIEAKRYFWWIIAIFAGIVILYMLIQWWHRRKKQKTGS